MVVCGQEHKLFDDSIIEATLWAKKNGWKSFWEECYVSKAGGRSSGVCVFVRSHLQAWQPAKVPSSFWKHRAISVVVSAGGLGDVLICSCYFYTSPHAKTRVSPVNWRMLGALIQHIYDASMPTLVGADWNMEPQVIDGTGMTVQARVELVWSPSSLGTCLSRDGHISSNIDYFLCTGDLKDVIKSMYACNVTTPKPHRPVYITFVPKPKMLKALVVSEPKRIPVDPPYGPVVPPVFGLSRISSIASGPFSRLPRTHWFTQSWQ